MGDGRLRRLLESRRVITLSTALLLSSFLLYFLYCYNISFDRARRLGWPYVLNHGGISPRLLTMLSPADYQSREETAIHLNWNISKGLRYPDGVGKWVYLVNGTSTLSRNLIFVVDARS